MKRLQPGISSAWYLNVWYPQVLRPMARKIIHHSISFRAHFIFNHSIHCCLWKNQEILKDIFWGLLGEAVKNSCSMTYDVNEWRKKGISFLRWAPFPNYDQLEENIGYQVPWASDFSSLWLEAGIL